MSGFFKRLFGDKYDNNSEVHGNNSEVHGDHATGDWSPVPVSAAAQAGNVIGWLQESDPPPQPTRKRRSTIGRMINKLRADMDYLTDEEREIIEGQCVRGDPKPALKKAAHRIASLPSQTWGESPQEPSPAVPSPEDVSKPAQRAPILTPSLAPVGAPLKAHSLNPAPSRSDNESSEEWVKVLKSYGEHLTDEELAIIRKQMD